MTWTKRFLPLALALLVGGAALAKEDDSQQKQRPKSAKKDVEAIGERNVGKGVNFYSIEKEIAMGKRMAQDVERHSKIVDDPVIAVVVDAHAVDDDRLHASVE